MSQPSPLPLLLQRLAALVADDSAAAAYLEPRHVIDVLADFAPARPSVGALLSMLRPLQPRLYSISSSQREMQRSVQATVSNPYQPLPAPPWYGH